MTPREQQALGIVNNPQLYKVCCGCESIVVARVNLCPNCHGYRFLVDAQSVIDQARYLSTRQVNTPTPDDFV